MEFAISKRYFNKKAYLPAYVFTGIICLNFLLTADLIKSIAVAALVAIGGFGYGSWKFIKYAKNHKIQITDEGIYSNEPDENSEEFESWESVSAVQIKKTSKGIKSIILKIGTSQEADLSRYENLDAIYELIEKNLRRIGHERLLTLIRPPLVKGEKAPDTQK